jgi:Niemann-Pick C1 protein
MLKSISRKKNRGVLRIFAERYYGPFILHPVVKAILALSFLTLLLPSIYYASTLSVGLDQREFLPTNNYVVSFMNASNTYYTVGPALYITPVTYDYTSTAVQNEMCDVPGCSPSSLLTWFQYAPYISDIPNPEYSWLDSYLNWAAQDTCCLTDFESGHVCTNSTSFPDCEPCFDLTDINRPNTTNFAKYLNTFLDFGWQENCSTIGQTFQYDISPESTASSMTGRFKLYYSVLNTQDDYIDAIKTTYALIDNFNGTGIIAYSDFFIYYEQFLNIRELAIQNLLLAAGGVFFITLILLGNPVISVCIVLVIAMIEIDVLGAMAFWKLSLNPVSLVNLLMAVGVSVAFCVHIGYAWTRSTGTAHDRAYRAVVEMLSVVFSGITMGKLVLVIVLGITSGAIFKVTFVIGDH